MRCVTQPSGIVRHYVCGRCRSIGKEDQVPRECPCTIPYALSHFICKELDRDHDESCAEKKKKKASHLEQRRVD